MRGMGTFFVTHRLAFFPPSQIDGGVVSNIAAGRLRHRVQIERAVTVTNSFGETETVWEPFAERWAAVEPLSGREMFLAEQAQSEVSTRITIRHTPGISAAMRAKFRGEVFDIRAVRTDKESGMEYQTLDCATGLNEG